jgi:hypothetical protein
LWQVFGDQGYLKVKPGQKTVQLRMVKIEDVQLMDDSVSSGYSGFCIDNYSKVLIKDSCWSLCLLSLSSSIDQSPLG